MYEQTVQPPQQPGRRNFFRALVTSIGVAITAILGAPLAGFFALPAFKKAETDWKACGPLDAFPIGEVKLVPLRPLAQREWPEDWGTEAAWVYRTGERNFVIYNVHCTHVGCPVTWSPQARRFFSPCHGGVFDADGRVLAGPPPRPLDRYEVKIDNGVLLAGPVYRVDVQLARTS
jgi:quinol---cytochrome c reductase iron-sulfur subunit, bacillus type